MTSDTQVDYWPAEVVTPAADLVDVNVEQCFLSELLDLERFYGERLPLSWRDALQELIGQVEKTTTSNDEEAHDDGF